MEINNEKERKKSRIIKVIQFVVVVVVVVDYVRRLCVFPSVWFDCQNIPVFFLFFLSLVFFHLFIHLFGLFGDKVDFVFLCCFYLNFSSCFSSRYTHTHTLYRCLFFILIFGLSFLLSFSIF